MPAVGVGTDLDGGNALDGGTNLDGRTDLTGENGLDDGPGLRRFLDGGLGVDAELLGCSVNSTIFSPLDRIYVDIFLFVYFLILKFLLKLELIL